MRKNLSRVRVVLPTGLKVFHGTTSEERFAYPEGPAFFSSLKKLAKEYAGDLDPGSRGRVIAYRVKRDVQVLATTLDERALEGDLDVQVCEMGLAGYILSHGEELDRSIGDEIVLCDPEACLERVR